MSLEVDTTTTTPSPPSKTERSKVPPHSKGKKSVWYGWKQRPQQITLELMKRVLTDRLISDIIKEF